jgi:hypothetical protein
MHSSIYDTMTAIELTPEARALLEYLLHNNADDYIRSALIGYQLLVHEFGPDITVKFTLCCDASEPMLVLCINDIKNNNLETYDINERIERIHTTMECLMPGTYRRHVTIIW